MKNIIKTFAIMSLIGNCLYSQVMEVDEVVNLAINNNLQIKIAQDDIKINKDKKGQTFALYKPKLKLSGGYVHLSETPDIVQVANSLIKLNNGLDTGLSAMSSYYSNLYSADLAASKITEATIDKYFELFTKNLGNALSQAEYKDDGLNYSSVKLSFEQPLYTGGKITAVNKQVDISIVISELEKQKSISDITFETKKAYYNVVLAKRTLNTVNEIYKDVEKHLSEANSYYKAGIVSELDVMRAKAKLSEIKQKIVQAENAVDISKAYLNFVIGKDLPKDFEPSETIIPTDLNESYEDIEKKALENRIELKIYEKKSELAKQNKKVVSSQKKPLVAIQGEYKYEGTDLSEEDPEWQIGIVGSWNIYTGGSTSSQVDEADSTIGKVQNGIELAKNSIKIDVKKAYLDMINSVESIKVAEQTLAQATEANRMASVSYSTGYGSSMEKMDAEAFLEQAKNSYDNAINQYIVAKYNLEKATGMYY